MLRVAPALLLSCALLVGCRASASDDAAPPAPEPPRRVLVAGDSLTAGYYASAVDRGFATSLPGTRVDAALSGARTWRIARLTADVVADEEPFDVVVLEAGANDVGKSTLAEWRAAYADLLDVVVTDSPGAEIVCLGPWNAPVVSRPYELVVEDLCVDHTYLPLSDLYADDALHGPVGRDTELGPGDEFHPNDRGHQEIADRILAALG